MNRNLPALPPGIPDHIPDDVREELRWLLLTFDGDDLPIGMVWVFGSYARGDYISRHDVKKDGSTTVYKSDLDLLIVFTEKNFDDHHKKCRFLDKGIRNDPNITTSVHLHFINSVKMNRHLKNGHYLYSDIVKEGFRLLDTGEIELASPKDFTPGERQGIGNGEFKTNFETALGFQNGFEFYFLEGNYALAAFHLHQVAEQIYRTLIFVFINYRHRTHDLKELEEESAKLCPAVRGVIPRETAEESRRFALLQRSYINARYASEFPVEKEDLLQKNSPPKSISNS
jgi:HEPN domain-containing protein/predicted nucleotidyltransferase